MANEISFRWSGTGDTLYAQIFNSVGNVYNGATFEAPVDANWGTYDIPLTEAGTATQIYRANFPALASGVYVIVVYKQLGGAPAVTDQDVGSGEIQWDGAAKLPLLGVLTTQLTESYAALGAAPTVAQALLIIQQILGNFAISGTTLTVYEVDGVSTAATYTLDDATNPTSLTRAS